jgi:hypothetical protein
MKPDRQDYYFTFGAGQEYDGQYVIVMHSTFGEARLKMVKKYGIAWSGQYSVPDFLRARLDEKLELLECIE